MKFSQIYKQFTDPLKPRYIPLKCAITGEDVLRTIPRNNGNLKYYLWYMDSLGEVEKEETTLISFSAYNNVYAKIFEPNLRKSQSENEKINKNLCKILSIPERYSGLTFGTIKEFKEQQQLIGSAKNWCNDGFKNSLLLGGEARGIGKTTSAVCGLFSWYAKSDNHVVKYWHEQLSFLNNSIVFIKEPVLYTLLPAEVAVLIDRLASVEFLVYDDMFRINNKRFINEILTPIIEQRIEDNALPTIITTAYPQSQFEKNYPDIYSRLSRGKIYYSYSKIDYRKILK